METGAAGRESLVDLCIQHKDGKTRRRQLYAEAWRRSPLPSSISFGDHHHSNQHQKQSRASSFDITKDSERTTIGRRSSTATSSKVAKMGLWLSKGPSCASWSMAEVVGALCHHPLPCACAISMLFFMGVEYTLRMVPPSSPPLDLGFILTQSFHNILAASPILNSILAALNTVFVGAQATYILSTLLMEGRPRPTIAAFFMFTCRGILGCSTQLPVPQEFLGSGVDFPVGNVSFFLFFSGHVAGSMIASLDMRRMRRYGMASAFDTLNFLQGLRLLSCRGHYTIDLAVGVGAGYVFDILAGKYVYGYNKPLLGHDHNQYTQRMERPSSSPCCCYCCGSLVQLQQH